jgi:hypothetical protein
VGGGGSAVAGVGSCRDTQGDRNWSSLGRQKDKRGLLVIIHILWATLFCRIYSKLGTSDYRDKMLPVRLLATVIISWVQLYYMLLSAT